MCVVLNVDEGTESEQISELKLIFIYVNNNLIRAFDTFTLVKQYGFWWERVERLEHTVPFVDGIIAIKLKEYLLIQLTAIFFDRSRSSVASVHTLKEVLPECKKCIVEKFTNRHEALIKRIGFLRNKVFAHNEIIKNELIQNIIEEYRDNVSNEELEVLFNDAFYMLTKLARAHLDLPMPFTCSPIQHDIIAYFKQKFTLLVFLTSKMF